MLSHQLSRESDQSLNYNWKDSEKLELTDPSDKNGTTKETKAKDSKNKEKLPRKTDLLKYLNVRSFSFLKKVFAVLIFLS